MFKNILFVCVGNLCRSPMAEGLAKHRLASLEPKVQVHSAGLKAVVGEPAAQEARELALLKGLDISAHRARQLTEDMVTEADLILVMEDWQKKEITKHFPHARGKVFLLGHWQDFEIVDPYQQSMKAFEHTWELIEEGFKDWNQKIWKAL